MFALPFNVRVELPADDIAAKQGVKIGYPAATLNFKAHWGPHYGMDALVFPFANAFFAVWQFECSIQVARNHWAGIFKTASECLKDRDRTAGETHTKGIGNSTAATEPTESV